LKHLLPGQITAIHHIGSTAIRGIYAKPTIDLLPVVTHIGEIDDCQEVLSSNGYLPWVKTAFLAGAISSKVHPRNTSFTSISFKWVIPRSKDTSCSSNILMRIPTMRLLTAS